MISYSIVNGDKMYFGDVLFFPIKEQPLYFVKKPFKVGCNLWFGGQIEYPIIFIKELEIYSIKYIEALYQDKIIYVNKDHVKGFMKL